MDRFLQMRIFVAVVDHGSFAKAAQQLLMSPSGVTRAIAALEQRLGILLLSRNTRRLQLTDAGRRFADDCKRLLLDMDDASEASRGVQDELSGPLVVSAPVLFGEQVLTPIITEFLTRHPKVQLRLLLSDQLLNLADEGIHVALRIAPTQSGYERCDIVGYVRRVVCASPAYLAEHGTPETPQQLLTHRLIDAQTVGPWAFVQGHSMFQLPITPWLRVNANQAALSAAEAGFGITHLMSYQVASALAAGRLQPVLTDYQTATIPVQLVCPAGRRPTPKTLRFIEFCTSHLRDHPALLTE